MKEDLRDGIETFSPIAIQRPNDSYNNTYWMVTDPTEVSAIFANQSGWAYIGYIGTGESIPPRAVCRFPNSPL